MSLKSLDSRWTYCSCNRFSMSRNHYLKIINSGLPFRILLEIHLTGSCTRTPKYSCRDCLTGDYPMKNDQREPELKPLWGLTKKPLSNKSKEKRILETVNRMITRIQNDERKCLWPNTPTRPAWGCLWPSRKTWPPSVTDTILMNQTSWDVPSLSSLRKWTTHQNLTHGICSSDESELASFYAFWLMWVWISVSHGYPA